MCCQLGKRRTAKVRKGLGTEEERRNPNPKRIDYGLGTAIRSRTRNMQKLSFLCKGCILSSKLPVVIHFIISTDLSNMVVERIGELMVGKMHVIWKW